MKQGSITGAGPNAALIALVAPESPAVGTLGDAAFDGLGNYAPTGIATIDFGTRKVGIFQFTEDNATALASLLSGRSEQLQFTMDDDTKASSLWTVVDGDFAPLLTPLGVAPDAQGASVIGHELNDRLGYGRSARSSSSLIGVIEDSLAAVTKQGVLVINQSTKKAILYVFDDTTTLAHPATGGFTLGDDTAVAQATFTQLVDAQDPTVPKNVFAN